MAKKIGIKLGGETEKRSLIFQIVVVVVFALLATRLFFLQVIKGEEYRERATNNRVKLKRVEAPRGKIFDKNGELLATNEAGYRLLYLNERKYSEKELKEISQLLDLTEESVERRIKYGEIFPYTRENTLVDDLNEDEAHRIMEKLVDYPYLQVQAYAKREYLYDTFASHVLGYVKKISAEEYEDLKDLGYTQRDTVGKNGVEKEYDYELQGKPGYKYIEVNALNRIQKELNQRQAIPGKDMYLTIDSRLQREMEQYFEKNDLQGSFIAINPKNGEIITMVSYPTYSLNMFTSRFSSEDWNKIMNDKRKPLNNRSIAGEYPPGSVFKPLLSMELLKDGLDPNKQYFDNGYYQIGKWKWRSWKRGGHGYVDLKKAITESANVYFYRAADEIGPSKLIKAAGDFGVGKRTGIDSPGERAGRLPDGEWKRKTMNEPWYGGDTINFSIGQGYVTTTPIQILQSYVLLANKGIAYKPHLVKKLEGKDETIVIPTEEAIELDYSKRYYNTLTNAMINTVESPNGTAKALRTEGLQIAAKTGSAQNSQFKKTHAWAAGYFPAKNPEIVFVSFAEGAGGGGSIAAPAAKRFIDKYLELKNNLEQEEIN